MHLVLDCPKIVIGRLHFANQYDFIYAFFSPLVAMAESQWMVTMDRCSSSGCRVFVVAKMRMVTTPRDQYTSNQKK